MGESSRTPATSIADYSKCKVRNVIRFLAQSLKKESFQLKSIVHLPRHTEFREEMTSVRDDENRSGRPSVVTDDLVKKIEHFIH